MKKYKLTDVMQRQPERWFKISELVLISHRQRYSVLAELNRLTKKKIIEKKFSKHEDYKIPFWRFKY